MANEHADVLKQLKTKFIESRRAYASKIVSGGLPAGKAEADTFSTYYGVLEVIDKAIADETKRPAVAATAARGKSKPRG